MENEVLVEANGVSKKFCKNLKHSLLYGIKDLSNDFLGRKQYKSTLRRDEFWAVKDISFELRRGECLGLIGHNGAGKSTLLKMLNGLIRPDEGEIRMRGRVGALIELGAGFNPILTGRENIYVNGQVLGFSKKEIDEKFDSIVEFAEIEEFIDTPVQNYSSGMKVRLGFAVAAQMEPDVLIIDEVMAVGDTNFVVKSFNKINEIVKNSAVIIVSHNLPQVAKICTKIGILEKGRVIQKTSNISNAIENYLSRNKESEKRKIINGASISSFSIMPSSQNESKEAEAPLEVQINSSLPIQLTFEFKKNNPRYLSLVIKFFDSELRPIAVFQSQREYSNRQIVTFQTTINNLPMSPGLYTTTVWLLEHKDTDTQTEDIILGVQSAFQILIKGGSLSNYAFTRLEGVTQLN